MDHKFLRACTKSIKANRERFARDFAVFSKKNNKKTRQILKIKRSNTFGNWPIANGKNTNTKKQTSANTDTVSISQLEQQTKTNLLNARKLRRKYDIFLFPESETTPLPIFKFEELSQLNPRICDNLKKWKIRRPLPVQMQVIPIMIQGHEVQCCAPTGSGKTIAFVIPILTVISRTIDTDICDAFCNDEEEDTDSVMTHSKYDNIKCLIIAPTTVLAHQIYRECVKYADGLSVGVHLLDEDITSHTTMSAHIMISTPKPLASLIRNDQIPFAQIEIVILDEADALFDSETAAHVEDIELIISKCNHSHIQRAFFSATLDDKVMNLTQKFLNDPYKISIGHGICGAANVSQELRYCGDERGKFIELLKIIETGIKPPVLLFVADNNRIIELSKQLKRFQSRLRIDALHESLSVQQKNDIVTRFREEDIWFLISNDELSRGMDFRNVQSIINYDFPGTSQQYIHRIGRTGRADRCGTAITFWCDVDNALLPIAMEVMKQSNQEHKLPQWMLKSVQMNRKIDNKERVVAKLGKTKRGPIRRGGSYVHGTSVLKQNNKRTHKQKRKAKYLKKRRQMKRQSQINTTNRVPNDVCVLGTHGFDV
eukprot:590667_1